MLPRLIDCLELLWREIEVIMSVNLVIGTVLGAPDAWAVVVTAAEPLQALADEVNCRTPNVGPVWACAYRGSIKRSYAVPANQRAGVEHMTVHRRKFRLSKDLTFRVNLITNMRGVLVDPRNDLH